MKAGDLVRARFRFLAKNSNRIGIVVNVSLLDSQHLIATVVWCIGTPRSQHLENTLIVVS